MSARTGVGWTDSTWSVVTGCTRVSPGCLRCYIERTVPFRIAHRRFDGPAIGATTGVTFHPDRLTWPARWRKPRRIFVCSLSDLFHDAVTDLQIAQAWAVMAANPRHTFQVLTKRPARMRSLLSSWDFQLLVEAVNGGRDWTWPLPNVWTGVTAETQDEAHRRIPILLQTPAAVRWVSAEPLLEQLDVLNPYLFPAAGCPCETSGTAVCAPTLDWLVVGCESGPGARPMQLSWAEDLVRQCREAGTSVYVKQLPTGPSGRASDDVDTFPDQLRIREFPQAVTT